MMTTEQVLSDSPSEPPGQPHWLLVGMVLLVMHLMLAGVWWWMMPGGFPLGHPRFWVNQIFPGLILVMAAMGLYALRKQKWWIYHAVLAGLAAMWTAALATAVILFPISALKLAPIPFFFVVVLVSCCVLSIRTRWLNALTTSVAVAVFLVIGAALPFSQRAAEPETRPLGGPLPVIVDPDNLAEMATRIKLADGVRVSSVNGSVDTQCGNLTVSIDPLLTFDSRSPDRCWTIFAPRKWKRPSQRELLAAKIGESRCHFVYTGHGPQFLEVDTQEAPGSCLIEATTKLEEAVYSHLNSFCQLMISGHQRLSISFSPCPDTRIEFKPADYPMGRPMQAVYVDQGRNFHIVRASSGEKGPFTKLASGRLARDEPLAITLFDGKTPACRIELNDWSAQASEALSPTAGWGFPEAAIEFRLTGDSPESYAAIWFTLAGTSVGLSLDPKNYAVAEPELLRTIGARAVGSGVSKNPRARGFFEISGLGGLPACVH